MLTRMLCRTRIIITALALLLGAPIDGLRKLVCQNNPQAEVCKGNATQ